MAGSVSVTGELEPIETASADELRALQLDRLRWTVLSAADDLFRAAALSVR